MPFLASFIEYVVVFLILAAIAVGGVFFGRFLRKKKNAKASVETKE